MESQSVDHRWIDSGKFWSKPLFLFFTPFYGRLVSMFNHHDHVPVCITNWQKAYVLRYYTWWMVQFWSGKLLLSNRTFPIHLATLVYWRVSEPVAMSNGKPILEDLQNQYGMLWCLMGFFVGFQRCLVPLISQSLVRPKESATWKYVSASEKK